MVLDNEIGEKETRIMKRYYLSHLLRVLFMDQRQFFCLWWKLVSVIMSLSWIESKLQVTLITLMCPWSQAWGRIQWIGKYHQIIKVTSIFIPSLSTTNTALGHGSWSLRKWTPEKVRNSAEDAEWLEMVRVGLFIIKQRFLMKINRAGDTMGVTPDGVLCDPSLMISAHRVTLGMNEPLPNISIVWETENGRIKIKTKRWWILERRSLMWKICGKFKNQMYNVHLAWCFNQIWSYQLYKTAAGRFKNSDMILFTLNTSNGDQESSFTYLALAAIIRSSRPVRILRKLRYRNNPGVFNKRRI